MPTINEELRGRLVAMAAHDRAVRARLIAKNVLHEGYHPEMEEVHRQNAASLKEILHHHDWPTPLLVGEDGAKAAWLIVLHAIGDPPFQRDCLKRLQKAGQQGKIPLWQAAMLEDRISMFEGRPQLYGTQLETDTNGVVRPYKIDKPELVDLRRKAVGLEPLSDRLARAERLPPPSNPVEFQKRYHRWLREVGWRK